MATATERKFTSLRKRLDQLGYRQPLGLESLPLVEKLFGDLLHTTESLKGAKQQLGKQKEQKGVWEQDVEPYRADNARVIKENIELHKKIINLKENAEQRTRELKAILRRLEHENTDLKFLNTQYLQRLRVVEKDSERKTIQILELQEKNFQAVIQTPGGKKKQIPFRRQRMEIDCILPDSKNVKSNTKGFTVPPPPDPYVVNLLQVADQRMADLQSMTEEEKKEKERLEESLQSMRKQVENREIEIERLTGLLKGGRPAEALAADGARHSQEKMVAHLNIQVDFLQQASRELEKKLSVCEGNKAQLEEKVAELSSKNARICSELQEIGDLVKQTELERQETEEKLKEEIEKKNAENTRLQVCQSEIEGKLHSLDGENAKLLEDNQHMAKMLASTEGDRKEVSDLLERLLEERKNFQRQCNQFKEKESIMQQRIAELEPLSPPGLGPLPEAQFRKIRKERDDLKSAVSNFETELLQIQMDTKILAEDRDNFKLLYEQVSEDLARAKQHTRTPSGSGAAILRRIEGERDHALLELRQKKTECSSLQDRVKSLQDTQQHDLSTLEDKLAELQVQFEEACTEKDELSERLSSTKELLSSIEKELQNSTKALAAANSEVVRQRSKVSQLQVLVDASEKTKLEQEKGIRSQAINVQTAQSNLASLSCKIAQLTHEVSEREEKIDELRHALTMLDQDHDQLVAEADKKDESIASLTLQLEQKDASLAKAEGKAIQLEVELHKYQEKHKDKEKQVERAETELNGAKGEIQAAKHQLSVLTQRIGELKDDLNTMTQENQAMHGELQHAVSEKESMELKLQEYAQSILHYEETVALKEQEKIELVKSYQNLSQEAEKLNSHLQKVQGDSSSVKMDLVTVSQDKKKLEDLVEQQAVEIQVLKTYEQQLSNMSHALSKMEGALRQEQEEKKSLMSDLEVTRELCVQLDRSKESLSSQLSTHSLQYEQVLGQMSDAKAEIDLLHAQLNSERVTSEQLQTLLSGERQKEFHAYQTGQEKVEEIQHLRQLLAKLETDRLSLAEQTRKLRADTTIQTEALQRMKSELASEKFQKEHIKQQLDAQRHSLTLLTSPKLHANTRTPSPPPRSVTSPQPVLPTEPVLSSPQSTPSQQPDSMEEDELLSKEKHTLLHESAKVVGKLLEMSSSSTVTPTSISISPTKHITPPSTSNVSPS